MEEDDNNRLSIERAGRILTCRVSKFPCSVLLALSTNEIQAQISWVGQSTIAGLTLDTLLVICRWWSCSSWSKCWTRASVRTSLNWRFYHDRWVYLKIFKWIFGQYRTPGCITQLFQVPVQWDAPIVCCFYWHKHIDRDWLTNWYFCVAHLILCAPDSSQERRPSVV